MEPCARIRRPRRRTLQCRIRRRLRPILSQPRPTHNLTPRPRPRLRLRLLRVQYRQPRAETATATATPGPGVTPAIITQAPSSTSAFASPSSTSAQAPTQSAAPPPPPASSSGSAVATTLFSQPFTMSFPPAPVAGQVNATIAADDPRNLLPERELAGLDGVRRDVEEGDADQLDDAAQLSSARQCT